MAQALVISSAEKDDAGGPVLRLDDFVIQSPGPKEVLIRFLAAPINPLDVLVLTGQYPVKPNHFHQDNPIPGYDGVAEVIACGESVKHLSSGDIIIPSRFGIGSWRTHAIVTECWLQKISLPREIEFALGLPSSWSKICVLSSLGTG